MALRKHMAPSPDCKGAERVAERSGAMEWVGTHGTLESGGDKKIAEGVAFRTVKDSVRSKFFQKRKEKITCLLRQPGAGVRR